MGVRKGNWQINQKNTHINTVNNIIRKNVLHYKFSNLTSQLEHSKYFGLYSNCKFGNTESIITIHNPILDYITNLVIKGNITFTGKLTIDVAENRFEIGHNTIFNNNVTFSNPITVNKSYFKGQSYFNGKSYYEIEHSPLTINFPSSNSVNTVKKKGEIVEYLPILPKPNPEKIQFVLAKPDCSFKYIDHNCILSNLANIYTNYKAHEYTQGNEKYIINLPVGQKFGTINTLYYYSNKAWVINDTNFTSGTYIVPNSLKHTFFPSDSNGYILNTTIPTTILDSNGDIIVSNAIKYQPNISLWPAWSANMRYITVVRYYLSLLWSHQIYETQDVIDHKVTFLLNRTVMDDINQQSLYYYVDEPMLDIYDLSLNKIRGLYGDSPEEAITNINNYATYNKNNPDLQNFTMKQPYTNNSYILLVKYRDKELKTFFENKLGEGNQAFWKTIPFKSTYNSKNTYNYSMRFINYGPGPDTGIGFPTSTITKNDLDSYSNNFFNSESNGVWAENPSKIIRNVIELPIVDNNFTIIPRKKNEFRLYGFEFNMLTTLTDIDFVYNANFVSTNLFLLYQDPTTDQIKVILYIKNKFMKIMNPEYGYTLLPLNPMTISYKVPQYFIQTVTAHTFTTVLGGPDQTPDPPTSAVHLVSYLNKNGPGCDLKSPLNPHKLKNIKINDTTPFTSPDESNNYEVMYVSPQSCPAKRFFIVEYISDVSDTGTSDFSLQYIRVKSDIYNINNILQYKNINQEIVNQKQFTNVPIFYPSDISGNFSQTDINWQAPSPDPGHIQDVDINLGEYQLFTSTTPLALDIPYDVNRPYPSKLPNFSNYKITFLSDYLINSKISGFYGSAMGEGGTSPWFNYTNINSLDDPILHSFALIDMENISTLAHNETGDTEYDKLKNLLNDETRTLYNSYYDISLNFVTSDPSEDTIFVKNPQYLFYKYGLNFNDKVIDTVNATAVINKENYIQFKTSKYITITNFFLPIYSSYMNVEVKLEYKNESGEWEPILDYIMGSKQPSESGPLSTSDTTRYIYIPDTGELTDPIYGHKVIDVGSTNQTDPFSFLVLGKDTVSNNLLHVDGVNKIITGLSNTHLHTYDDHESVHTTTQVHGAPTGVDSGEAHYYKLTGTLKYYKKQSSNSKEFRFTFIPTEVDGKNTNTNLGYFLLFNAKIGNSVDQTVNPMLSNILSYDYSNILGKFTETDIILLERPYNIMMRSYNYQDSPGYNQGAPGYNNDYQNDVLWKDFNINKPHFLSFEFNKYTTITNFDFVFKCPNIDAQIFKSNYCLCYLSPITEKIVPILFYTIWILGGNSTNLTWLQPITDNSDLNNIRYQVPSIDIENDENPWDDKLWSTPSLDHDFEEGESPKYGLIYLHKQEVPAKRFFLFGNIVSIPNGNLVDIEKQSNFIYYARINGDIFNSDNLNPPNAIIYVDPSKSTT